MSGKKKKRKSKRSKSKSMGSSPAAAVLDRAFEKAGAWARQAREISDTLVNSRSTWIALIVVVSFFGMRALQRGLLHDTRFLAYPTEVSLAAPAWADIAVVAPLEDQLRALGPISLFDSRFDGKIRGALEALPGVERVRRVRRHWPRRYSVEVELRRPYAVITCRNASHPVTFDQIVLPQKPYAEISAGLFRIGPVPGDAPVAGERWRHGAVRIGLDTLAEIAPHLAELAPLGLRRIDVSGARDQSQGVVLLGIDGIRVRWGRPGSRVRENPVAKKIAYLIEVAADLDRVRGREIDVRYGTLYLRNSTDL